MPIIISGSYLGRAVATTGDIAAHRLACRTGVAATAAAAAEARVVFAFVAAAEGVAARREARMVGGASREGKRS